MQSLPRGLSFGTEIEYDIVVPHDTSVVPRNLFFYKHEFAYTLHPMGTSNLLQVPILYYSLPTSFSRCNTCLPIQLQAMRPNCADSRTSYSSPSMFSSLITRQLSRILYTKHDVATVLLTFVSQFCIFRFNL